MNYAGVISEIGRASLGHMAIRASLGVRWIVERPSSIAGDPTTLPVVVLVEAARPTVVIHRKIQMDLMTRGAELRRLFFDEGLHEHTAVRFGIQLQQKINEIMYDGILALREVVHRRVPENIIVLSHG